MSTKWTDFKTIYISSGCMWLRSCGIIKVQKLFCIALKGWHTITIAHNTHVTVRLHGGIETVGNIHQRGYPSHHVYRTVPVTCVCLVLHSSLQAHPPWVEEQLHSMEEYLSSISIECPVSKVGNVNEKGYPLHCDGYESAAMCRCLAGDAYCIRWVRVHRKPKSNF